MKRCSLTFLLTFAVGHVLYAATPSETVGVKHAANAETIADLINRLGDDQYAVRRHAEHELMRLGPEAHDQLKQAEGHADLEVAERASYILQRLHVDWILPNDSAEVRRILTRYDDLSQDDKEARLALLAKLPGDQGLPVLCRIARLERLPVVARRAALAVVASSPPDDDKQAIVDACRRELGDGDRASVAWIELWLREQTDDRRETLADWNGAIDDEIKLFRDKSPETSFDVVYTLMDRRLETCGELSLVDETTDSLLAIVELLQTDEEDPQQQVAVMAWALQWIVKHRQWEVLEQIRQDRRAELYGDRNLLYCLAAALSHADRTDEAAKLAERAFNMPVDDPAERIAIASAVADLGAVEWALREYRTAIDDLPIVSADALRARVGLAAWLHDREDYKGAADVLGEFFDELAKDNAGRRALLQEVGGRHFLNPLEARRLLYLAAHFHARERYERQRETLEQAYNQSSDDPDILIAMYRSPGADEAYRQRTRERIARMSDSYLQEIEQSPDDPSKYNQWAWLISNTEGDYAQAVEHSRRSLELSPDEPSYLDTLGRCYFTAGDVENAVKSQRRAVELAPQYQIMRRQLAEFEKALAAKEKKGDE